MLPVVFGAVTGYFLGVSETTYLVLSVIGILGGVGAGYDHVGAKAGAGRGVIAGALFGGSILAAHEIHGATATAHLPEPAILLVAVTTVLGMAFAALGGWLRARSLRGYEPAEAPGKAGTEPVGAAGTEPPATPPPAEPSPAPSAKPSPSPAPAPAPPGTVVSLNSGTFEDYRSLGMSVTQARRVVEFRDRDGGYSTVDDLDRVPGFSREFLAQLKTRLNV